MLLIDEELEEDLGVGRLSIRQFQVKILNAILSYIKARPGGHMHSHRKWSIGLEELDIWRLFDFAKLVIDGPIVVL